MGYNKTVYRTNLNSKVKKSLKPSANKRHHTKRILSGLLFVGALFGAALIAWYVNSVVSRDEINKGQSSRLASTGKAEESLKVNNFSLDIPYSKTIGFVGDSLTYGCCAKATPAPTDEVKMLGKGYKAINTGLNGSTTTDWRDHLLSNALTKFKNNKVEIVQIMLGTNDVGQKIPVDETISNLRNITERLRDEADAKVIIINEVPFTSHNDDTKMREINARLPELVDGKTVFLGDRAAYDYFAKNQSLLVEGLHMTEQGYNELAKLWLAAFKRIVVEPKKVRVALSDSRYYKNSTSNLTFTVDKSSEWWGISDYAGLFIDDSFVVADGKNVKIDGDTNSVKVTLSPEYLRNLSSGEHTITLRHLDGTKFSQKFTIKD